MSRAQMARELHIKTTIDKLLRQERCTLQAIPQWLGRDDGTWSLITRIQIKCLPKESKEAQEQEHNHD